MHRSILAAVALTVGFSTSALAQDLTVGVSWSNFQEERWKTDEAAIVATARLGFTDDPMPEIGRHYVTLFVGCTVTGGRARVAGQARDHERPASKADSLALLVRTRLSPIRK